MLQRWLLSTAQGALVARVISAALQWNRAPVPCNLLCHRPPTLVPAGDCTCWPASTTGCRAAHVDHDWRSHLTGHHAPRSDQLCWEHCQPARLPDLSYQVQAHPPLPPKASRIAFRMQATAASYMHMHLSCTGMCVHAGQRLEARTQALSCQQPAQQMSKARQLNRPPTMPRAKGATRVWPACPLETGHCGSALHLQTSGSSSAALQST